MYTSSSSSREQEKIASLLRLKSLAKQEPDFIRMKAKCKPRFDALTELEDIYKQLQLNDDEDLLDRAERRDLPSRFQLLKYQRQLNKYPSITSFSSDLEENEDSSSSLSLTNNNEQYLNRRQITFHNSGDIYNFNWPQNRTPPLRRSGIPDLFEDDYAVRKLNKSHKSNLNKLKQISKSTSYLLFSSAYTPSMKEQFRCRSELNYDPNSPDIEKDDLYYRRIIQSDGYNVTPPPPPFGIPLPENSLVDTGSKSYLDLRLQMNEKIYKTISPHLIKDDMAFRNYRKESKYDTDDRCHSPITYPVTLFHTYNNITRFSTLL